MARIVPFKRPSPARRPARKASLRPAKGLILAALSGIGLGVAAPMAPPVFALPPVTTGSVTERGFLPCAGASRNACVVDGDTFWLDGVKVRIADIDTPEISTPKCRAERERGLQAKRRLQSLLSAGPFELRAADRDEDRYGRKLRTVHRGARSLGEVLVGEGLARRWDGARRGWCAGTS